MLSITLAQRLKAAGLSWTPAKNDFFIVPERGLDDSLFVISDMAILVQILRGQLSVTFHGTPEWALDHIIVTELVWLPTEAQLREQLENYLVAEAQPALKLLSSRDGYICEIQYKGQALTFEAFGASDAYGLALLHTLGRGE
jgi:hypothetical protein